MKHLAASALLCLLGSPLMAACESAGPRLPPAPALLSASTAQCRAQLNDAVRELRGQAVALAADAFVHNDSVVLTTVGQSASGRMLPPTDVLRLQLAPQGCQLRLERSDRVVALPLCACRATQG
jgi:hypothetical protein